MTDQEINEAVAQKLNARPDYYVGTTTPIYPDYCHSIEAAWKLVDKIPGFRLDRTADWHVLMYTAEWPESLASAATPAMAICLAFLKLP